MFSLAAVAGVACACCVFAPTASAAEPFDLFILKAESSFFAKSDPYVRTAPGGSAIFKGVYVRNIGEGNAPATRVGFRWLRLTSPRRRLPFVKFADVQEIDSGEQRRTGRVVVPLPTRNGTYRIDVCANAPKVRPGEYPRANNCSALRRRVVVSRELGIPEPEESILLEFSPSSGQFGSVPAGSESSPINFTVSNRGRGSTGPGTANIQGRDASAFRVGTNGCAGGLSGASACRVSAVYAPTAPGAHEAYLIVMFSGGTFVQIPLSGSS